MACKVHAQQAIATYDNVASPPAPATCLPDGHGYVRARLSGAVQAELVWGNEGTECTGAVRPTDGGIRLRFSRPEGDGSDRLVLLFGVAGLHEGESARGLPVNVTVIREGRGEFYSTQGDNKCTLDEVKQEPFVGIPRRSRSYRITARGFCTHPARAVRGEGVVLLSRFDIAGRVDFDSVDDDDKDKVKGTPPISPLVAAQVSWSNAAEALAHELNMGPAKGVTFAGLVAQQDR